MGKSMIAVGLAVLVGCGEGEGMLVGGILAENSSTETSTDTVKLTIVNEGGGAVYGDASEWYGSEKHTFTLQPGESVSYEFSGIVYRVKAHVWRSSDSLLILDDWWDGSDLQGGKTVTVYP